MADEKLRFTNESVYFFESLPCTGWAVSVTDLPGIQLKTPAVNPSCGEVVAFGDAYFFALATLNYHKNLAFSRACLDMNEAFPVPMKAIECIGV